MFNETEYLDEKIAEIPGGENLRSLDKQALMMLARGIRINARRRIHQGSRDPDMIATAIANEINIVHQVKGIIEKIGQPCLLCLCRHIASQEIEKADQPTQEPEKESTEHAG